MTFAVAEQTFSDVSSGLTITFGTDPTNFGVCTLKVNWRDSNDYMLASFTRNGGLLESHCVDAGAEADREARAAAQKAVDAATPTPALDDSKLKAKQAAVDKSIADAKKLLAKPPVKDKFAPDAVPDKKEKSSGKDVAA